MIDLCSIRKIQSALRKFEDELKAETGLSDEELAFYDAIAGLGEAAFDRKFLCDLVRDAIKARLGPGVDASHLNRRATHPQTDING